MRKRLALPLAACAMITVACNGNDEIATSTTTVSAATAAPTPATTSLPPTNRPSTTPGASTTSDSSTTTAAPTTTNPATSVTVPPATTAPLPSMPGFTTEEIVAIDRDFREGFRLFYAALMDPNDEAAVQAALGYTTGAGLELTAGIIDTFRANSRIAEPIASAAPSYFIEQGPSRIPDSAQVALVLCEVAPYKVYEIGTGPGGSDTIINEKVRTQRVRIELSNEEGVWKRADYGVGGQWEGAIQCPSE